MKNVKSKFLNRLLAGILSAAMVLAMMPLPLLQVHAAGNMVKITVQDENGKPIEGASVALTIQPTDGAESKETKTTDAAGEVDVIEKPTDDTGSVTVSAVISKEGYADDTTTIKDKVITSSDSDNISVTLKSTKISDVVIEGKELTCLFEDGEWKEQEAVSVTGSQSGDVVTYKMKSASDTEYVDFGATMPTVKDAGTYSVEVTVKRDGFEDLVKVVETIVQKAVIPNMDLVAGSDLKYSEDEAGQPEDKKLVAFTVTEDAEAKVQEGDRVTWTVNNVPGETLAVTDPEQLNIPTESAIGDYKVKVLVERGNNYEFSKEVMVNIGKGTFVPDVTVEGIQTVYEENKEKPAVKVSYENEGEKKYTLYYIISDKHTADTVNTAEGKPQLDDKRWTTLIPTVKDAGFYTVWVKAVRTNYVDAEIEVKPAKDAIAPFHVLVEQADRTLTFNTEAYNSESSDAEIVGVTSVDKTVEYGFGAKASAKDANEIISYSIPEGNETETETGAKIDANGSLSLHYAGTVTVEASITGKGNYKPCKISHTLNVSASPENPGDYIKFEETSVDYTFGEAEGTVSLLKAEKQNEKDDGSVQYSFENTEDMGLSVDAEGKVTISDYVKLDEKLKEEDGRLALTVNAKKEAHLFTGSAKVKYAADQASYSLIISYAETPENPYKLPEIDGTNDWYKSEVIVTPADGYEISKKPEEFAETVALGNEPEEQGENTHTIYLQNADGGITAPIQIPVKIDTGKPENMQIEISDTDSGLNPVGKFVKGILKKFGFFKDKPVTITFTAEDTVSGVDYFEWEYLQDEDASESIENPLKEEEKKLKAETVEKELEDGTKIKASTASVTVTADEAKQYRGNIAFTATDIAGNISDKKSEDTIIVVDTVNPKLSVKQEITNGDHKELPGRDYYSGDVTCSFLVEEANFFAEDAEISVSKDNAPEEKLETTWVRVNENEDKYQASFVLSDEGDYVVSMKYKEASGNIMVNENGEPMERYQSQMFTIDKTNPVVDFSFDRAAQKTIFKVTERYFRPEDIVVTGTMKDIQTNDINFTAEKLTEILRTAQWKQDGIVYTYEMDNWIDGIYDLTINYADIIGHKADTCEPETFIIDHTAPANVKVEYAKSVLDSFLEVITLGFYNPSVTVRFTTYDMTSGVRDFTWNYTKESGASEVNRPTDTKSTVIEAVQDNTDKSKFTAVFTLPDNEVKQLRGYLAAAATDNYDNSSEKVTDEGNIIVVDTISPTMTAEYSKEDGKTGSAAYYKGDATVTFTVTEANFFAQDVKVTVTKDGGSPYRITPEWRDKNVDVHVGTYTLSGDGDYVIHVEYMDRSENKMKEYTSHVITIDTIAPVIDVKYSNDKVINNITDSEGQSRKYYDDTQTAVVTVKEHNFNADEVDFSIIAKDVTGKVLDAAALHEKTKWSVDSTGDVHTITITYPGDANYTFDVAYTDLAMNKAKDYAPDYFTVDKTAPVNLKVSYSASVLDDILESLNFGFYNSKVVVTITADDMTSGVYGFVYSYLNARGVSNVNTELVEQTITAADIRYSDDGKTGTAIFEIPKAVLSSEDQFNGSVTFSALDRAHNKMELQDSKRLVVDNITPTAQVSYNEPTQNAGGIGYYDGNVDATITVNEANFYAQDVNVSVTKDGASYPVSPSWTDSSTDVHVGTFSLADDGDYFVNINYKDKSNNTMAAYTSEQLTVDTEITEPVITVNGEEANGRAFKDEVVPGVSFEDINFENYEISLTRTRYDDRDADVAEKFIGEGVSVNEQGGTGSFDTFEKKADIDGIYTMTVSMTDKAGHSSETSSTFTVNRFGSVYEYDDYLVSLIKDGGAYVQEVEKDLIITEYNADRLLNDSLDIEVSCDGKPLSDVKFDITPEMNEQVSVGSSGWYQYRYTISKDNFNTDGVYKISVSSKDATGNAPEITNYENKSILFRVDSTAPEINSVTGLEESIVNAQEVNVKYTVYDTIGLSSVDVYVNGKEVDKITDFGEDINNFEGAFTISENSAKQKVRLVVEDLAGNITDTDSKDFESAYAFNSQVTVSTNAFVRWYANKVLFFGTIGGAVVVVGGGTGFVLTRRKKKFMEAE